MIIVGGGFGGVGLAIALKKARIDSFVILERSGDVGGVWRDNTYPGAACDVPSRLYSFSFERDYEWKSRFGTQAEIHAYIRFCIEKYDLARDIRLNAEVARADFDETKRLWIVTTAAGERLNAQVLVSAVGLFNRAIIPDIPGQAGFAGVQFHSSRWNHAFGLEGKSVAVIGTGASAIQFVPAIAGRVARLHVFQRSPQYVLPRLDGPASSAGSEAWRAVANDAERLRIFLTFERNIPRRRSDELTRKGELGFLKYLEGKVKDSELRRKLTPHYPLGCKRVLFSNEWYDVLTRPNVDLVDEPVDAILPSGVRTSDGRLFPADAIIYGTGFSPPDFLSTLNVTGLGGKNLSDTWRDGAEAYLGVAVTGFPNFFMLYGPNTNVAGSIVYMLESQSRYIVKCIHALDRTGSAAMHLRAGVQQRFNEQIQRRLAKTVIARDTCHSYFRTPTGRITTQWPGFMFEYRRRTQTVKTDDYEFLRG